MYGWGFSCSLVGLVLIIAIMSSSDSLELMVDGVDVCASSAQLGGGADIDPESSCSEDDDPEFMCHVQFAPRWILSGFSQHKKRASRTKTC